MFELEELKQKSLAVKLGILPVYGEEDVNDVKTIHGFLMIAGGRSPNGGLKSALRYHKVTATGTAHDAKYDALNTLKLYFHLLKNQ